MIVTENFVVLNLPKTGSTFVCKVLKHLFLKTRGGLITRVLYKFKLWPVGFKEIMVDHPYRPNHKDQHGCYDHIPEADKHKKVLSVVRDPYLRLESIYKFRSWARNSSFQLEEVLPHFPSFPDLSMEEFLDFQLLINKKQRQKHNIPENANVGNQTIQFIRFFFKNNEKVLQELSNEYVTSGAYKKDMCDVVFLRNENLNEELATFLGKNGFQKGELEFVRGHEKVNVTKSEITESLVTKQLVSFVNSHDWMLMKILSDLGIDYRIQQD